MSPHNFHVAVAGRAVSPVGMPPLECIGRPLSRIELWPTWLIYCPVALYWLFLSLKYRSITLPSVSNPLFPASDLCGASKAAILSQVPPVESQRWVATFTTLKRSENVGHDLQRAFARMADTSLALPLVVKPDISCRGVGVRLVETEADLAQYLAAFPVDETLILQRYVPYECEAGVLYSRLPGEARGRILSLTLKYFPYVVGDGRTTLKDLILRDRRAARLAHVYFPKHAARLDQVIAAGTAYRLTFAGNHFGGAIFRDGDAYLTPAMNDRFDRIARAIPEFYFGRFDVRFPAIGNLQRGEDFTILEINGATAEPINIWDRATRIVAAYRTLFRQFHLLFEIGHRNRKRGFKCTGLPQLLRLYWREARLTRLYPQSH